MTPEEQEQVSILCERIYEEKDHEVFMKLVRQLNELLARKEQRLRQNNLKTKPHALPQSPLTNFSVNHRFGEGFASLWSKLLSAFRALDTVGVNPLQLVRRNRMAAVQADCEE
jgi:hypothetical protein